jgi:molybdenum cofactor cytidylyltransferase
MKDRAAMQVPRQSKDVPVLVLTAGASKRLGQPKALLPLEQTTLIEWVCTRLEMEGFQHIIVTREELTKAIQAKKSQGIVIVNPDPERGRMSSIKEGVNHLVQSRHSLSNGLVIAPVDRPGWPNDALHRLIQSNTSSSLRWNQRGGHPVYIHPSDIDKLLQAHDDVPLREYVMFSSFEVEAPFLHLNIDTPSDIEALERFYDELQNQPSKSI